MSGELPPVDRWESDEEAADEEGAERLGAAYFCSAGIMADETPVPVTFLQSVRDDGNEIADGRDGIIVKGTRMDLPLWLAVPLADSEAVRIETPRFCNNRVKVKLNVGAAVENLGARCPHFYGACQKLYRATGESWKYQELAEEAFRLRTSALLTDLERHDLERIVASQLLMTQEELQISRDDHLARDESQRWRHATRRTHPPAPRPVKRRASQNDENARRRKL